MIMRASYSHHYRRMVPELLDILDFRSNNELYRPVIRAIQLEGGPGYVKKSITLSGFQTYPGPPERLATTPKQRLSASLFALEREP